MIVNFSLTDHKIEVIFDLVVRAYKEAIHFTEDNFDNNGISSDVEFSDDSIEQIKDDCQKAIEFAESLESNELTVKNAPRFGHDLWLTRNGHGAGFWDGDCPEKFGNEMTDYCHKLGPLDVWAENELIWVGM